MVSAAVQLDHRVVPRRAAPRLRVVRGGRYTLNRAGALARQAAVVLVVALVLGLVTAIVASQARLTELTGEIDAKRADLAEAQTTYDYLTSQMDEIANMSNLGTVAEKQLGPGQDRPQPDHLPAHRERRRDRAQREPDRQGTGGPAHGGAQPARQL